MNCPSISKVSLSCSFLHLPPSLIKLKHKWFFLYSFFFRVNKSLLLKLSTQVGLLINRECCPPRANVKYATLRKVEKNIDYLCWVVVLNGSSKFLLELVWVQARQLWMLHQALKYRWRKCSFANLSGMFKTKCYCLIWAHDVRMNVWMKWHNCWLVGVV